MLLSTYRACMISVNNRLDQWKLCSTGFRAIWRYRIAHTHLLSRLFFSLIITQNVWRIFKFEDGRYLVYELSFWRCVAALTWRGLVCVSTKRLFGEENGDNATECISALDFSLSCNVSITLSFSWSSCWNLNRSNKDTYQLKGNLKYHFTQHRQDSAIQSLNISKFAIIQTTTVVSNLNSSFW